MKCVSKSGGNGGNPVSLNFQAVTDGSEENKKFFAATPNGSLQFGTVNAAAAEQIEQGKEYYVDINPA
jgi:hypothetical protein